MIQRYKVLKDCLDANGEPLRKGEVLKFEFENIVRKLNVADHNGKHVMFSDKHLESKDFFEQVEEGDERVAVKFGVNFPNGDYWSFGGWGKVREKDIDILQNQMEEVWQRWTNKHQ